jgi:hypothetical protein
VFYTSDCASLLAHYRARDYPEPYEGREAELRSIICTEFGEDHHACKPEDP